MPVTRQNPPVTGDVTAPADVGGILRRACYDCHSHETVWPWYSRVAPASWLVAHDVDEGRGFINRTSDLLNYCTATGIADAVVDGSWYRAGGSDA